jgi:ferredoxin
VCLSFCPTGALTEDGAKISFDPRICNGCLGCYGIVACVRKKQRACANGTFCEKAFKKFFFTSVYGIIYTKDNTSF